MMSCSLPTIHMMKHSGMRATSLMFMMTVTLLSYMQTSYKRARKYTDVLVNVSKRN